MSRWLAIWDKRGAVDPAWGPKAFQTYPWHAAPLLSQYADPSGTLWMGALRFPMDRGEALLQQASGKVLLWDGAIYPGSRPPDDLAGLDTLNGRWSFLQHDPLRQTLWMARDRVGVKPLYYWTDGVRSAFASEPKLILALPFVDRAVDQEAVFDYFVLNKTDAQRQTLFKGIRQLPPSHALSVDMRGGRWTEKSYYELPFSTETAHFDPEKALEYQHGIRQRLEEAVRLRLDSLNAPPATLLSGGLDSSVLACLIRENSPGPMTAITASYHEKAFGEQHWAHIVAERLGARWLQTFPTIDNLQADLEDFIYSQDTPTFSSGTYAQYRLFRLAAAEGIPTVFDGQGADALFAGHLPHLPPLWSELLRSGQFKALIAELNAYGPPWKAGAYWATNWLKYQAIPGLPSFWQRGFKSLYFPELQFLNPDILEANRNRYRENALAPKTLNEVLRNGYFGGPLAFLLKCVDRASAWAGVDTCTPYSDDANLMEYVFSIPGAYKIRGGTRKYLLRQAAKDLLPPATFHRHDKIGLATPNNAWMAQLRPIIRGYIEEQDEAIFQKKKLLQACDQFFNPAQSLENYRVYKYLSLIVWRSVYKI